MLYLITGLGLLVALTQIFVPRVVEYYGRRYFDDKRAVGWRGLGGLVKLGLVISVWAAAVALTRTEAAVWLALMVAAGVGVVRADQRYQVIPDVFQGVGLVGAGGYVAGVDGSLALLVENMIVALALMGGLTALTWMYRRWRRREALGMGDVKLAGWLAVALGSDVLVALTYAVLAALVLALPIVLLKRRTLSATFAFGPFIVLGALLRAAEIGVLVGS